MSQRVLVVEGRRIDCAENESIFEQVALDETFQDFLTLPAYEVLE